MTQPAEENDSSREIARRNLTIMLRVFGLVAASAIGAVFMPHSWMDAIHRGIGMGELPETPITGYLSRSLSLYYTWFGLLVLFVSFDVERYLPYIRFLLVTGLGIGMVQMGIDFSVGMPRWWAVSEGAFLLIYFSIAIWMSRRAATGE